MTVLLWRAFLVLLLVRQVNCSLSKIAFWELTAKGAVGQKGDNILAGISRSMYEYGQMSLLSSHSTPNFYWHMHYAYIVRAYVHPFPDFFLQKKQLKYLTFAFERVTKNG